MKRPSKDEASSFNESANQTSPALDAMLNAAEERVMGLVQEEFA